MPKPAVFLDRDGTINEQMGYINHVTRFQMLPKAAQAIRLLNDNDIPVVVVSNQSGLARGYFPKKVLDEVHEKMNKALKDEGAYLDGIYYCPHHPEAKEEEYRKACDCRKPKTGLFIQAAADLELDLTKSYVVGDRFSDMKAAANCGATGILVLTGYGRGDLEYVGPELDIKPDHVAEDLYGTVEWILADMRKR